MGAERRSGDREGIGIIYESGAWLNRFAAVIAVVAPGCCVGGVQPRRGPGRQARPACERADPARGLRALPQLSSGVAALVNDDVISTYDLRQRALLLIVTAGVPATQENLPQIQQEALRSLVDEHLQMQELRSMEKKQKFPVVADDSEVDRALQQVPTTTPTA